LPLRGTGGTIGLVFDALLLDFYGTLVHEDDDIIRDICNRISTTAVGTPSPGEVGRYWWSVFSAAFTESHSMRS